LKLIQKNNSIIKLYQTELEYLTTKKISLNKTKSVSSDFAWRLEEYFILKRRLKQEPKNAELYYHLGNFYYAHDFEKEGISSWKQAYELGYKDKIFLVTLYRANKKIGNKDTAFNYLVEAYKTDKNDPYIFEYYVDEIHNSKGVTEAIKLLEDNYERFDNVYSLKAKLMNIYMGNGYYDKLEALLLNSDLHDTHRLSFGEFWKNLKMAKGYIQLKENNFKEALEIFTNAIDVPKNIAQHYSPLFITQTRRYFYMGYCNYKLGNQEKADELWTEALKLKRDSKFQVAYKFRDLKTIYYQAFCLKGLGRYNEAERYLMILADYAKSSSLKNNPEVQKLLLALSITGLEDMDDFEKWDSELGLIKINANFNAPEE
ncbi:MAG: tetratricopeptide repeat protein, partial [Promethearchaeota archaeon]